MGSAQIGFCCRTNRRLIIPLLFILVSSLTLVRFTAEGRAITNLFQAAEKGVEEEKIVARAQIIGSRPPRCDRRCSSCGHCEAVQVPVTTKARVQKRSPFSAAISNTAYSRGDDISNYKPMSWKCKCGSFFFNP